MTELLQIYKCDTCGNMVEVVHTGAGTMSCCGSPMKLIREDVTDAALEKHVPVIKKVAGKNSLHVEIGSAPHPMEQKHHIEWIEVITPTASYTQFLDPEGKPEAFFECTAEELAQPDKISSRAYCNIHGLWKTEKVISE